MNSWGINGTIINGGNKPVPFYASDRYREFLLYLADMRGQDTIFIDHGSDYKVLSMYNMTGMWNDNIRLLFFNLILILENIPEVRLLITPPETSALDSIS
jgi:hypothetical protein